MKQEVKTNNLSFGLSILHGWIRFFKGLLHLSYKLPLNKWQLEEMQIKTLFQKTN